MLEYAVIGLLVVLIASVWLIGQRLAKPAEPDARIDAIIATLDQHRQALARLGNLPEGLDDVRTRIVEGGVQRKSLQEYLSETRRTIDGLSQKLSTVSQTEDKNQELLERLHRTLLGASSRGKKGENLLREQLRVFPPEMLATNYKLGGGTVEFALKLPDNRVLPIDSKWPEPEMIERLEAAETPEDAARFTKQIERRVLALTRDIRKYIDPEKTVPLAVAALPDSIYANATGAHYEAFKQGVLLMPYSNAAPLLLAMYGLFLRYGQTGDLDKIKGHLGSLDTLLNDLEKIIDDQLSRGATMVTNATNKCSEVTLKMRRSLAAVGRAKSDGSEPEETRPELFKTEGPR